MQKSQNLKEINKLFKKDLKLLEEFTTFIETKINKTEVAKHGGSLSKVAFAISDYAGEYNPDNISIDTYNKLRANAQIAAGLKVIKLPILGQQWTTICDNKDIAEFIDQLLRPLWTNLLSSILTGVDYGFAAHEIVYDVQDLELFRKLEQKPFFTGKAVIWKKFKSLYPDTVKIKLDDKENFDGIVQKWVGKDINIPVEKSFIFTHDKGDSFGNLFGNSRLIPVYDVWYWWINLVTFMMRYFERKGTPPVIVKFPLGQTKDGTDHADIALEIGKSLIGESVVAIPSKTYENTPPMWDINYLTDDKRGEMFLSALTFFENKMLRGLFVPERTITQDSSSKAGSYSLSQTHADMFLLGEEALIVDIENQINKYILRRLIEYNFGPKAPQCYIKIERITEARKVFLKDVFMEMIKNGTAIPAAREIADIVGVPLEDDKNQNQSIKDNKNDKKNGINNSKNNKKKESDDSKKYSDVNLTENKWWREPDLRFEEPKLLADIEDNINEIEKEFLEKLVDDIWVKQREMVINKLEKNKSMEDLWYSKIDNNAGGENIVLWQPLRIKMMNYLSNYMGNAYIFGQNSAVNELKSEDKINVDKKTLTYIRERSRSISDKYFANMKYSIEMIYMSNHNKTDEDLLNDVRSEFETLKDRELVNIVTTESMLMVNKGRAFIVNKYK